MKTQQGITTPDEMLINKIYFIRGQKVMLDRDLAELYGVETRRLNEQVRRNIDRFPEDFMFQLTPEELENLMSHFATSSWGGIRKMPLVFTEHGVLMLSSVLNSQRAIQVNIQIMRVYTKLREAILTNKDILLKLEQLEKQSSKQSKEIQYIFDVLKKLIEQPVQPRTMIGYKLKREE
ncbi:MAG: ORF6N domain-containing protein [Bacteroidetes bacterium]|nr:ORF6N domain-containing protein [Bacteroidota bacterium]